jgi:hypothetical protein
MKMKIYLFRFAVAAAAFVFGISVFSVRQYFQSVLQIEEQKTESAAPAKIELVTKEESTSPAPNLALTETLVIEQANKDEAEEKYEYEFDAAGSYYLIGKAPKGFEDLETFVIETSDYESSSEKNNWEIVSIPPKGSAYPDWEKQIDFVRLNISNKQISFETEKKNGISFQFVGKFIESEVEMENYTAYAILEGKLTKTKNGKKIAERNVKFGDGGC